MSTYRNDEPAPRKGENALDEAAAIVGLGRVVSQFRCSRPACHRAILAGPGALAGAIVLLVFVLFSRPTVDPRLLVLVPVAATGLHGCIRLASLLATRLQIHEHGLVLRDLDGVRAIHFTAVRAVRGATPVRGATSVRRATEPLTLDLVHGESLALPEGLERAADARELIELAIAAAPAS